MTVLDQEKSSRRSEITPKDKDECEKRKELVIIAIRCLPGTYTWPLDLADELHINFPN